MFLPCRHSNQHLFDEEHARCVARYHAAMSPPREAPIRATHAAADVVVFAAAPFTVLSMPPPVPRRGYAAPR